MAPDLAITFDAAEIVRRFGARFGPVVISLAAGAAVAAGSGWAKGAICTVLMCSGLYCLVLLWRRQRKRAAERDKKMATALRSALQNGAI
jgi:hypothetical protein